MTDDEIIAAFYDEWGCPIALVPLVCSCNLSEDGLELRNRAMKLFPEIKFRVHGNKHNPLNEFTDEVWTGPSIHDLTETAKLALDKGNWGEYLKGDYS